VWVPHPLRPDAVTRLAARHPRREVHPMASLTASPGCRVGEGHPHGTIMGDSAAVSGRARPSSRHLRGVRNSPLIVVPESRLSPRVWPHGNSMLPTTRCCLPPAYRRRVHPASRGHPSYKWVTTISAPSTLSACMLRPVPSAAARRRSLSRSAAMPPLSPTDR
jgi:hypothetical protein